MPKKKKTQLQELKEQAQRQYLLQEINLVSTNDLVNNPKIQAFFSDLLRNYAEKFAKNKKIELSLLPLKFAGLYSEPNPGNGYGKMGHNPEQSGDYTYLEISFDKMIGTCSHELAHYLQLVKHGKSSCESDLKLNNGRYDKELASEQEK
ncbi:13506_t:CDS:2 [Funneliformis geosporum]|nr:13506_t:CDS:2 [Funneliformis geosporum]